MADTDPTLYDKEGVPIRVGDVVSSKYRGGRHYGKVIDIAATKEQAEEKGVLHPPKVLFYSQHGEPEPSSARHERSKQYTMQGSWFSIIPMFSFMGKILRRISLRKWPATDNSKYSPN